MLFLLRDSISLIPLIFMLIDILLWLGEEIKKLVDYFYKCLCLIHSNELI